MTWNEMRKVKFTCEVSNTKKDKSVEGVTFVMTYHFNLNGRGS